MLILFLLSKTQNYVPVVTLLVRYDQKLSKLLSKGFETSLYWHEYQTKSKNKNITNEHRYFLESNFVRKYYLPKSVIKNCNTSINGKIFYHQPIDSDIKRYEEIKS